MADLTIRDKFFDDLAKGARWDVGVSIARGNPLPLDANSIFASYADLETYAAGVLAYPGQIVAVVNEDSTGVYYLDQNREIKPVGVIPAGDNKSIEMDESDVISLHDFGKAYYKYVAEDGDVAAHYERVVVGEPVAEGSEEVYAWKAGLEPKVVTENGQLVIGWYEPNPTTIEGVNDQVTAVQGTVADLELSVGVPSDGETEATGLYKEVEDVQEEVKVLADEVGSSEDTLGDDVNTLWAHVNDHTGRLEELEAIDHSLFATTEALAAEADRADKAEKANAAAIKAVADDYLKGADKTELQGNIDAVAEDVAEIAGDYLKAADIENLATKAEVEAEANRAKGVEASLQTQIDTIMNNPDTEGVINSINEFTQYIEDHGEIAEGFRTDIDQNKADIATEAGRAAEAEGALSDRLDVLEAIDHDAYIAADTALKSELNGEIAKKADQTALEAAIAELEEVDGDLSDRLDAALGEEGTVAQAIAAAEGRAIAEAGTLASAAEAAAIADAASKYATTGALSALEADVDGRLNALEAFDHATYATKDELKTTDDKAVSNANAITNLTGRLDGIVAQGGEPNVINNIKVNGVVQEIVDKAVDIEVPTNFSDLNDDSGFDARITAAKAQADKGVTDAATAQAKAEENKSLIDGHASKLAILETAKGDHESRIATLEGDNVKHAAEYESLSGIVTSHTEAIAKKAEKTEVDAVLAKASANESAIKTLNETTIPGIQEAIDAKANASALNNYYTKTEIGEIAEDKTIVQMIADSVYNDTAVKKLISDEVARAEAAEQANADEIARVNSVLVAALENEAEGLDSIKELADWVNKHGAEATEMAKTISANADAIAAINHETTGILAVAKEYTNSAIAGLPAATVEALGLVRYDGATINKNENNQLYVAKVSTDILEQGSETLILNGGTAKA